MKYADLVSKRFLVTFDRPTMYETLAEAEREKALSIEQLLQKSGGAIIRTPTNKPRTTFNCAFDPAISPLKVLAIVQAGLLHEVGSATVVDLDQAEVWAWPTAESPEARKSDEWVQVGFESKAGAKAKWAKLEAMAAEAKGTPPATKAQKTNAKPKGR